MFSDLPNAKNNVSLNAFFELKVKSIIQLNFKNFIQ